MSYSISTLLTRNLQDVFGENDPERRRAAIDELYTEDVVFYDPSKRVYRGRDEIDRIAGAIKATHPDFGYQLIAEPEEVGDGGRVPWVSGRPGDAPAYAGTDFIIARTAGLPLFISFSTSWEARPNDGLNKNARRAVALVTGAAQSIGEAIAVALAERGAQVIATDLTPPQETVTKIGPSVHAFQLDVTQEEDWRSIALESRGVGEVDIVVNNAGYFPNRSIDELDLPTWRKTMATNLDSQSLSVKSFLPAMRKKKWGRFVGISSNMVGLAIPGMSHYIATKMGIIGFMRGLANDVAGDGITANAVLPGLTNTLATAPQSEEQKRATWEQQAIKRLGEPEDVTGAVLFLTSDDASFITGQAIVVDGGQYRIS